MWYGSLWSPNSSSGWFGPSPVTKRGHGDAPRLVAWVGERCARMARSRDVLVFFVNALPSSAVLDATGGNGRRPTTPERGYEATTERGQR